MFPNASGDAPCREECKQSCEIVPEDTYSWQATYKKWRTFADVRKEGLFFDVVLKTTDGSSFPAHRIILCACSPYFKSLFSGRWQSGNKREISIPGVTNCVMNHLLQFAYNREVNLTSLKETKELLIVASHLGVEDIVRTCFSFLLKEISIWNCVDIWDFSRTYYCRDLEVEAKSYILEHIVKITCCPENDEMQRFWNLSARDLAFFLSADELNVVDETIPFWIIVRWVSKDAFHRHKYFYQLMLCVRWCSLSAEFVEEVVKKNNFVVFCKDARQFIDYVKEQLLGEKFKESLPPQSSKSDMNGNFLISPFLNQSDLMLSWRSPRLPRNLVLVVGGWCGDSPSNSAELYEPRSKKWRKLNKSVPPLLKRPRAYHSVLYKDSYMYVIGGYDGHITYNSCDRYNVETCVWQEMCGMHSRRCYVGVAYLDGCIYALGGSDGSEAARLKTAEKFFPSRNLWQQLPDMLERRSDAGACSLERRLYVAGGFTGRECVFTVEYYEAESSQWIHVNRMTVARSGVSAVSYRGRIVVLGGYDGQNRLRSVEAFDPKTNQWTMMGPMLTMRSNFTACVIEGKLLVMGGFNGVSTCADVEYYDDPVYHCRIELCSGMHRDDFINTSPENFPCFLSDPGFREKNIPSTSLQKDVMRGRWKCLPKMKISRSALSCCVLTSLSPVYLKSLMEEEF